MQEAMVEKESSGMMRRDSQPWHLLQLEPQDVAEDDAASTE